jgi:hypothetical protein
MASTKFKKRDLNRYRKIYPYLRRRPVWSYCADKETVIEVGSVTMTDSNSGTFTFSRRFSGIPIVTAVTFDSENNDSADINVFIREVTTNKVVLDTSQNFTGKIQVIAIYVSS